MTRDKTASKTSVGRLVRQVEQLSFMLESKNATVSECENQRLQCDNNQVRVAPLFEEFKVSSSDLNAEQCYLLGKKAGSGGMGTVYIAQNEKDTVPPQARSSQKCFTRHKN
mgnify:CR=1 FL=1